MEFLSEYGVFLAKTVTIVIAIMFVLAAAASAAIKNKKPESKEMQLEKLNDKFEDSKELLEEFMLDKESFKTLKKEQKKKEKAEAKLHKHDTAPKVKPRVFVLDFDGDIKASAVDGFRESVTAVLQMAEPSRDEVIVRLESPGGMVHSYGLAAAQLDRIKKKGV